MCPFCSPGSGDLSSGGVSSTTSRLLFVCFHRKTGGPQSHWAVYQTETLTVSIEKDGSNADSDASGQSELMVCACWDQLVAWPKCTVLLHTVKPTQVRGSLLLYDVILHVQVKVFSPSVFFVDVFHLGCRGPEASL